MNPRQAWVVVKLSKGTRSQEVSARRLRMGEALAGRPEDLSSLPDSIGEKQLFLVLFTRQLLYVVVLAVLKLTL